MLTSRKPATTHTGRHNAGWVAAASIGLPANISDQPIEETPIAADTSPSDRDPVLRGRPI